MSFLELVAYLQLFHFVKNHLKYGTVLFIISYLQSFGFYLQMKLNTGRNFNADDLVIVLLLCLFL